MSRLEKSARALLVTCLLSAALPASAEEKSTHFDFGWDDGPTYQFSQSMGGISEYDPTGRIIHDVLLRGRIGGSLYLDGGRLYGFARQSDETRVEIRRARFNTRGEFTYARHTDYKVEFAYDDGSVFFNDFYLRWKFSRWIDSLKVGYFDPPVSLDALAGTTDRPLMELPPPVAAFAPGFRLGAQISGSLAAPSLAWALSLSSVGQRPNEGEASSSSPIRITGRLVWRPWLDESGDTPSVLHLGASLRYQISGSGSVRFRSRPESYLSDYAVDTGDLEGGFGTGGLELAWRRGPLLLQAELLGTEIDADGIGGLTFWGAYGQASFSLTGESHPYDAAEGVFRRIVPAQPYLPFRGQWGALELALRLSWLDLSDGSVNGGRMLSLQLGPSWVWNSHLRVLAGYLYAHTQDRPEEGSAHVAQLRLEFAL